MNYDQMAGCCSKCGAPYSVPSVWHGILPPSIRPTCSCWNVLKETTDTDYTIKIEDSQYKNSRFYFLKEK